MKEEILKDFISKKDVIDSFKERVINLLSDLIRQEKIIIHHISGRTKEYESLSKKIDRKIGKYNSLEEITDVIGLRIITHLESDVDLVSNLITKEFTIDEKNSIDKRKLNTDQFGYKSLHLVISLNETRAKLTEYKGYGTLKCEVQIRSILQHAWAEIEHDLGYKGKSSVPNQYKRNFNRLAALLETADVEFDRLKRELTTYEAEVSDLIKTTPETVQINQASLAQFNIENTVLKEARELLTKKKGWSYSPAPQEFYGITERFEFFNIHNIKELEEALLRDKRLFFAFIEEFTKDFTYDEMTMSIVLFYYQHFLAAKSENPDRVMDYFNFSENKINSAGGGKPFVDLYKKIKNRG